MLEHLVLPQAVLMLVLEVLEDQVEVEAYLVLLVELVLLVLLVLTVM